MSVNTGFILSVVGFIFGVNTEASLSSVMLCNVEIQKLCDL